MMSKLQRRVDGNINTLKVGEKLYKLRVRNCMAQSQIAEAIGVSARTYYAWENGIVLPDTKHIVALARVYDVTIENILCLTAEDVVFPFLFFNTEERF